MFVIVWYSCFLVYFQFVENFMHFVYCIATFWYFYSIHSYKKVHLLSSSTQIFLQLEKFLESNNTILSWQNLKAFILNSLFWSRFFLVHNLVQFWIPFMSLLSIILWCVANIPKLSLCFWKLFLFYYNIREYFSI